MLKTQAWNWESQLAEENTTMSIKCPRTPEHTGSTVDQYLMELLKATLREKFDKFLFYIQL